MMVGDDARNHRVSLPGVQDVFILGAGFSMAIAPDYMPSTDVLGQRAIDQLAGAHKASRRIHSDTCDGISCDEPRLVGGKPPGGNFEVWLSRLAQTQPYLEQSENDRSHTLFAEVSSAVASQICQSTVDACIHVHPDSNEWLPRLIRAWHDRKAEVITFNYDTLIEACLAGCHLPLSYTSSDLWVEVPSRGWPNYRLVGPSIVSHWAESEGAGDRRYMPVRTFRLYKLHGSIHWYWDDASRSADSMVEIGLPVGWNDSEAEHEWLPQHRAPGKVPIIVPPTVSKNAFFDNPKIQLLWRSALKVLRNASRIFVVGYSMPEHDLLVSSMLLEATRGRSEDMQAYVVNRDPGLAPRLRAAGLNPLNEDFAGGLDCVQRFTEAYAAGALPGS